MFFRQFLTILSKNWMISYRTKDFLRQLVSVFIILIFIYFTEDDQANQFTTPFYLAICITSFARSVATTWIQQKQNHQKQLQKIMGVSQKSYSIAWYTFFAMNGIMIVIVTMALLYLFVITQKTNFAQGYGFQHLVLLFLLYALSNVGFVMIISSFFSSAKTGASVMMFIQLLISFLYFLRLSQDITKLDYLTILLSLLPQMCFNMIIPKIAFVNHQQGGYQFNITYQQAIGTLIGVIIIYPLIAFYLDQVLPNEEGTHKHPLFFLGCDRKSKYNQLTQPLIEQLESNESSAKYQQKVVRNQIPVAKLKNVSKSFKKHQVINNLTLNFYTSEIFCLLGHNGAGKSTTINLMTGLLSPNSGLVELFDMNYFEDKDLIRKYIGLCLQYNVLYDNLTVQEHLEFYYKVKNDKDENLHAQVQKTINDCALAAQKGKFAKDLSGGNKRKLCLANSLIGGSTIIFLDEPSSGLDPNSRQSIWSILKNLQNSNKCIILTTHHLQEAQYLSNRIAIMSKGKLIILGDKSFITQKFNSGYHVTITLNKNKQKAADICRQIIAKSIKNCIEDKQAASGCLKFLFPLNQIEHFSQTIKQLQQAEVGLISVTLSNLEDAFVKIGEHQQDQTEGFFQMKQQAFSKDNATQQNSLQSYQIRLPDVKCSYSFSSQIKAVFLKKMKTTLRSISTFVSIFMPSAFTIIGVFIASLAITKPDGMDQFNFNFIRMLVVKYFMVWAFIFTTSSYCGSLVLQRQKRFKYLTNVSGTRSMPYWIGNYAFDLIIFYTPLILLFISIISLGQKADYLSNISLYLIIVLFLFGFSLIGYSYLFSFIFQKSNSAYKFFPFINLVFFYFLPLIPSINYPQSFVSQYIMPLISPFVAFDYFFSTKEVLGQKQGPYYLQYQKVNKQLWICYGCLIIQAILYFLTNLKLQSLRFSLKSSEEQILASNLHQNHNNLQINQNNSQAQSLIKVQKLKKIYGNGKIALNSIDFSVNKGQIFGLLGPNGAGKSTSFNIITAALSKSSGSVKLFDEQVNKGIMKIFQNIGVCPQYNPLYQNMTVYEHLQYFCLVKGLNSSIIPSTIQFYCELLSLKAYKDVNAGVLSGGNKRKMCVAMAMIGNPKIAFFDEPSAGVDPISRRYLWKGLSQSARSNNTSMVLTTHSMNEAESLCSSIGILIKGEFVCLDSPQRLKQKYGKGYRINVTAPLNYHQELIQLVMRYFGEQIQFETVPQNSQFIVFIIKSDRFLLSKGFQLFQNNLIHNDKIIDSLRSFYSYFETATSSIVINLCVTLATIMLVMGKQRM